MAMRELSFEEAFAFEKVLADDRFHEASPLPDGHHLAVERFDCEGTKYWRNVCLCGWIGPAHRDNTPRPS